MTSNVVFSLVMIRAERQARKNQWETWKQLLSRNFDIKNFRGIVENSMPVSDLLLRYRRQQWGKEYTCILIECEKAFRWLALSFSRSIINVVYLLIHCDFSFSTSVVQFHDQKVTSLLFILFFLGIFKLFSTYCII